MTLRSFLSHTTDHYGPGRTTSVRNGDGGRTYLPSSVCTIHSGPTTPTHKAGGPSGGPTKGHLSSTNETVWNHKHLLGWGWGRVILRTLPEVVDWG